MKKFYAVMFEDSSVADVIASSREEALEVAMAAPAAPSCMAIQATVVGLVPPKMIECSTYDGWDKTQQWEFKSSTKEEVHVWTAKDHGVGVARLSRVYIEAYGFDQPGELLIYCTKVPVVLQKDGSLAAYGFTCTYEELLKGAIDSKAPVKFTGADGSTIHFHMEE